MIKLFRDIRKNLLNQGKTSKYLKYAIGEIILVMIGIWRAENLAPTLKGGFSKDIMYNISVDIPSGIEGERKGKTSNQ